MDTKNTINVPTRESWECNDCGNEWDTIGSHNNEFTSTCAHCGSFNTTKMTNEDSEEKNEV